MKKIIFISFCILIFVFLGYKKEEYTVKECSAEQKVYHQAVFKLKKECSRFSVVTKMTEHYDCSSNYYKNTSDTYMIKTINAELSNYNIPKEHVKFNKEQHFFYTDYFPAKTKDVSKQEDFYYNDFINDISFSMTLTNKNGKLIKRIYPYEYQTCLIDLKNKNTISINYFYGIPY